MSAVVLPLATTRFAQGAGTLLGGTGGTIVSSAGAGAGAGLGASTAGASIGASAAAGAETFGVGAVVGIALSLLAAHTARLKGAKDENGAAAQVIPAFDADIRGIADAFNAGQASASEALQALATVDQQVLQYLQGHVGAAGTQWNSTPTACDKSCTVGCCLYYFDLHPAIVKLSQAIQSGQAQTVKIPQIFPSKYGLPGRPSYMLNISPPAFSGAVGAVGDQVQTVLSSIGVPSQVAGISTATLLFAVVGLVVLKKLLS